MRYRVTYYCVCDIGKVREINQDNFIVGGRYLKNHEDRIPELLFGENEGKPLLLGVFDGMGGEECGEVASLLAAQTAAEITPGRKPEKDLLALCSTANERICSYMDTHGLKSMGTTAAMLAFTRKGIMLCNIGDSRIFRFAEGKLSQISMDHVVPLPNIPKPPLAQNLGIRRRDLVIEPYLAKGIYKEGDIYLICSDGLTDMVSNESITNVLTTTGFEAAAQRLLDRALQSGGRDNITIILCRIEKKKFFR
ncbi:MAG: serine/threonine-protein phosphatase [Lachnospiraceae bacterium]|nr:serine/threonine-protein phosphatase [Lachnospiraceae bacterium]